MATIYSLICWGGRTGKSVTVSSTTDYVTLTGHGVRSGLALACCFASGSLPSVASGGALAVGTTYYAKYISTSTFELYRDAGLTTKIDFTSNGSSLVMQSAYRYALTTGQKARYGTAGSERIYEGIVAWATARTSGYFSAFDTEVAEIGEAFSEPCATTYIAIPVASTVITSLVAGSRSDAYHQGVYGAGFIFDRTTMDNNNTLRTSKYNTILDGFSVKISGAGYAPGAISMEAPQSACRNMMAIGRFDGYGTGISAGSPFDEISNSLAVGFERGIYLNNYSAGLKIVNNTCCKNTNGFYGNTSSNIQGFIFNNISVGNTTNWPATTGFESASNNAGLSGEAWITASNPRITIATTDFVDYANNDYRVAATGSPQAETGLLYYGAIANDIAGNARPNYIGATEGTVVSAGAFVVGLSYTIVSVGTTSFTSIGASANTVGVTFKATGAGSGSGTATAAGVYDIGCYEYDHGNGLIPEVHTIDFSGLVAGSQIIVYTTGTTTELFRDNNCSTTESYDAAAAGVTVDYTILKAGYAPIRVTGVSLSETSTPVTIQQQLDRAYATPSGLTFGTTIGVGGCNFIVPVTSRVVTSLRIAAASTVQNWYSALMDAFIASSTNTSLKNVAFPVIPFGEASFTVLNGIQFSDGATSIAFFKRDGLRYSSDAGTTITAIWAAILTLNTPAGQQVKYRQATAGTITNAANTGPMDQLVQVLSDPNGDGSYADGYDYRGHMVLRAPKVGWSQPKPDLVATYGNLVDGLFVAALEPLLQYATTDADIDAAHLALDNTAKTYTITAAHTMAELYQRAQWWANQDAQWDADIPLVTTNGGTFTQPSDWAMIGVANLTGGTLAGGTATLAAGTQGIAYSGVTLNLGAAGTYTFTADTCLVKVTPTAPSNYVFGSGTFNGVLTVNNMAAHAITIEIPTGVTTSTTGNTGGAITFVAPVVYSDISITSMPTAGGASRRLQIINATAISAASRVNSTAYALDAIRLRQTGIGTENTAGLYLRCTTAGTSAGSPPTWNTTPGGTTTDGTAVWTTYSVLYYDADPAAASLADTYIDGEEFLAGETVTIRFAEMNGGTSFKTYSSDVVATATGFSALVAETADDVFATFALDGSSYESTFSPNYVADYLVMDSNTDFSGKAAFAYFCYLLTSSQGMYEFWGGMTAVDAGNIRINNGALNLYFDESAGFVKQTDDVRIFRADGTRPVIDPTTGGHGVEINWRTPVNVVTTGGSALTPTESAYLLAIPSASTTAGAVRTELSTELARVDVATSTRLATAGYTAPDNAGIAAIPDAETNAAAVFAQAAVTPMPSDVQKVNSTTITGTGVPPTFDADGVMTDPGDPWVGA